MAPLEFAMTDLTRHVRRVEIKKLSKAKAFTHSFGHLFEIAPKAPSLPTRYFCGGEMRVLSDDFYKVGRDMSRGLTRIVKSKTSKHG